MIRICNDTPVWFRPRRTVYFMFDENANQIITDKAGRNRLFPTYDKAVAALVRGMRKGTIIQRG